MIFLLVLLNLKNPKQQFLLPFSDYSIYKV